MKPISELTFEHRSVLLKMTIGRNTYAVGSLCADGRIEIRFSDTNWNLVYFTHFLPLSEIEQLKELTR
jgi:hypothetical protein